MSLNGVILHLSSHDDIMILRRDIFQALADPTRRSILVLLATQAFTAGAIASNFDGARSTISKHIQILTECGLLEAKQQGREIYYQIKMDQMTDVDLWLSQLRKVWEDRFDQLDLYIEKIKKNKQYAMGIQEEAFVISHSFEADIQTVYKMWVNPKDFSSWLGPAGAVMSFTSTEVREGGISQWSMTTEDGQTKYGRLDFKIINPNHLLVYAQNFCDKDGNFIKAPFSNTYPDYLLTTVNFVKEASNKTKVIVKWEIFGDAKEIERQTFLEMRPIMKAGWSASFDKLESLIGSLRNGTPKH